MKIRTIAIVSMASLTLAACSSKPVVEHHANAPKVTPTTSVYDAVQAWQDTYGSDVSVIGDDLVTLGNDATNGDVYSVGDDCLIVKDDVAIVLSNPPIPDPQSAADLAGLVATLNSAMDACITAVNTNDVAQLDTMSNELDNAYGYLDALHTDLGLGA